MRHDARPLDNLCDKAFVARLGGIPDADFVIAWIVFHSVGLLCLKIEFFQLLAHLANLVGFRLAALVLEIQEARAPDENHVTALGGPLSVAEALKQGAKIIEGKIRVTLAAHHFFEGLVRLAHVRRMPEKSLIVKFIIQKRT